MLSERINKIEFVKIDDLIIELNSKEIIGIDGCDGSGKTHLSDEIAERLKCPVVRVDKFVENDKGNYVEYLKIPEIKQSIKVQKKPFIIEGICLLAILKKLKMSVQYLVYVKKVNERGEWLDEDRCSIENSPEETIRKLEETRIMYPKYQGLSLLKKEIIYYHKTYKPMENANCVFKIIKKD